MILTGSEIEKNVLSGRIIISPFSAEQLNPNSYNYRLGDAYIELDDVYPYDLEEPDAIPDKKRFDESGTILHPGKLYLSSTAETIGSEEFVTSLIGKSSMGRLGLFLQLSADLGHQGEIHKWTLELAPCIPIKVYPHMKIGQVTFWKVSGERMHSKGYYKNYDAPTISRGLAT
ncbi:MAG: dCTP deaminase [Clostridiales bacterium]|jgi:dCTP deaminase|nr:dCTP deaminase [Clostridiales bacterium]